MTNQNKPNYSVNTYLGVATLHILKILTNPILQFPNVILVCQL